MTTGFGHKPVNPHLLSFLPALLHVSRCGQAPTSGSLLTIRHRDGRGQRFPLASTWVEKWKLSSSFEFSAKISTSW